MVAVKAQATEHLVLTTWCGPPFVTQSQDGHFDKLLIRAFARLGKTISIEIKPAERSLADANQGLTDGEFIRISAIGDMYPNLIKVPEPLYQMEFVVFSKMPQLTVTENWQGLAGYSIGYVIGWKIVENHLSAMGSSEHIGVNNEDTLFKLLAAGRIDVAVYSKHFGLNAIKRLGLNGIYMSDNALAEEPMYLFLHKRHRELIPDLASVLRERD